MDQDIVSAIEHYETLLADHYTWMSGGFSTKVAVQLALFSRLCIRPLATSEAIDLGCGPGFQSLALAELGFKVTSVDANAQMLRELDQHAAGLKIRTVQHDLSSIETCSALPAQADYAVCMGDTLIHLPSEETVLHLFNKVHGLLVPGGSLLLGFRDLSEERVGLDRFVPVRADDDRVMTCFLEYEDAKRVIVTDLIYQRNGDNWDLLKSSYRKLRLSTAWVRSQLVKKGFVIRSEESALGVSILMAQKL